ncbi:MAG: hypothetical protein K1X65_20565 [Caldilineales bacterium]|nr:hypothetical protein [Caldilineales bacterium]MCW5859345.1 hypothetical protein [Caldilineales bacterium]
MRFISNFLSLLLVVLFFSFLGAIALTIILGFSVGISWLLGRLFGFSLFEGALLALLAAVVGEGVLLLGRGAARSAQTGKAYADLDEEEDEEDEVYDAIPPRRFTEPGGRTFQTWSEYELSNAIYTAFQDQPQQVAFMNSSQQQELAIRLAQSAVAILKGKTARSTSLHLTRAQIERHLKQAGQMPYDNALMDLAVEAVNEELDINEDAYQHIIKLRLWSQTSDWWDDEES